MRPGSLTEWKEIYLTSFWARGHPSGYAAGTANAVLMLRLHIALLRRADERTCPTMRLKPVASIAGSMEGDVR